MFSIIILLSVGFICHFLYEYVKRKPMLTNVTQKYVLVTGCDTGFGNALVKKLDAIGCHVFAGCYNEKGQASLKNGVSSRVTTFQLDVSKTESVRESFEFVSSKLPEGQGLWGLVNNAGIQSAKGNIPLEYSTREDFQGVLDVNLLGTIDMTLTFLPLIKQAKGRLVNMASQAGRIALPAFVPYAVSKHGVEAVSDSFRVYLKQYDIIVSIIEPGFFATRICSPELVKQQCEEGYNRLSEEQKKVVGPEFIQKSVDKARLIHNAAPKSLDPVVNAYVHALLAVSPKKRYCCGWKAYLIHQPLGYAPSWIQDMVRAYKFDVSRSNS